MGSGLERGTVIDVNFQLTSAYTVSLLVSSGVIYLFPHDLVWTKPQ
jgi:hypothetical protein